MSTPTPSFADPSEPLGDPAHALVTLNPKDIFDFLQAAGTLGGALILIGALYTERLIPRSRLDEQRAEKKEAIELLRQSITAMDRLSDAVEARNRLEEQRLAMERERR